MAEAAAAAGIAAAAAPWATATKNVKKPLGEKGRTFRKSKCYMDPN